MLGRDPGREAFQTGPDHPSRPGYRPPAATPTSSDAQFSAGEPNRLW
jgi:hypothetical protein